jgi:hypothetical protein
MVRTMPPAIPQQAAHITNTTTCPVRTMPPAIHPVAAHITHTTTCPITTIHKDMQAPAQAMIHTTQAPILKFLGATTLTLHLTTPLVAHTTTHHTIIQCMVRTKSPAIPPVAAHITITCPITTIHKDMQAPAQAPATLRKTPQTYTPAVITITSITTPITKSKATASHHIIIHSMVRTMPPAIPQIPPVAVHITNTTICRITTIRLDMPPAPAPVVTMHHPTTV